MAIEFARLARQCVGSCSTQTVFISIDQTYISISGFLNTINHLALKNTSKALSSLQQILINIIDTLSEITQISQVAVSKAEQEVIIKLLKKFSGNCDIHLLIGKRQDPTAPMNVLAAAELRNLYARKMQSATNIEQRSHYEYIMNQTAIVESYILQLKDALLKMREELNIASPIQKLTPSERAFRGYDLAVQQRVAKNVEFLRGKFLAYPKLAEEFAEMTIGRYYSVPGMYQSHAVLAIDALTGMIFIPVEFERKATYLTAWYEQQDPNAATLDYIYSHPMPEKPQKIQLPPGYRVFPLELVIDKQKLSSEAMEVIKKTQFELFVPILPDLSKAKKREIDPKVIKAIESLEEYYRKRQQGL